MLRCSCCTASIRRGQPVLRLAQPCMLRLRRPSGDAAAGERWTAAAQHHSTPHRSHSTRLSLALDSSALWLPQLRAYSGVSCLPVALSDVCIERCCWAETAGRAAFQQHPAPPTDAAAVPQPSKRARRSACASLSALRTRCALKRAECGVRQTAAVPAQQAWSRRGDSGSGAEPARRSTAAVPQPSDADAARWRRGRLMRRSRGAGAASVPRRAARLRSQSLVCCRLLPHRPPPSAAALLCPLLLCCAASSLPAPQPRPLRRTPTSRACHGCVCAGALAAL
jgi:hypothetical protein